MIRFTHGEKTYTLRFDMSVLEWINDEFGNMTKAFENMSGGKQQTETILKLFAELAKCGAEYEAEKAGQTMIGNISVDGILTKHSSIGQMKKVMTAINEAIKDGTRLTVLDENDDKLRDDYLREVEAEERKN